MSVRADDLMKLGEVTMIEAFRLLLRMPDREKGWLKSGSRSSMPVPLVERWLGSIPADLALELGLEVPEESAEPRLQLSSRDVAKVRRAWWGDSCFARAVHDHMLKRGESEAAIRERAQLVMMVVAAKSGRMPGGFKWEDIGRRIYGRDWGRARCGVSKDGLRMRYNTAMNWIGHRIAELDRREALGEAA